MKTTALRLLAATLFASALAGGCVFCGAADSRSDKRPFKEFISARDGKLFEGEKEFRFISFNIPNLAYTEDDMRFEQMSSFRLPNAYEINDALGTIRQMGGRVARTYVLSIGKTNDPAGLPRHILGPGSLNEEAMRSLDEVLASANRNHVRLIIPFIDQWSWWGGITEMAAWHGKSKEAFFTDPAVKEEYKKIVSLVLNRVNTKTGVPYKQDKAVLAWELGNELQAPVEWVREMAPFVKGLAPDQLLAESYFTAADNEGVDIVQDHLYQGDPARMLDQINLSAKKAAGKKVYMVGEFGFITTEGMRAIIDRIVSDKGIAGGLIWSLRFHNQDGGFYWHHEPAGGDFFKAYHWPGGPGGDAYDEVRFMHMVRSKAFEIQGRWVPALELPAAPDLFEVSEGGVLRWRGTAGAAAYDVQRAGSLRGPWKTIAWNVTEDAVQYRPQAVDEFAPVGETCFYRVLARNESGTSKPSNAFGPVTVRFRTTVDEFRNTFLVYRKGGDVELKSNDARNFKEDCHRLRGAAGAWVAYKVSGRLKSIRVYAFGDKGAPELEFHSGTDGLKGARLKAQTRDFNAGKDMYNFRWPRLYVVSVGAEPVSGVSIAFSNESQLSRVELEYE